MNRKASYLIAIEKSETGYSAYSPDVPGCIATGQTLEETTMAMRSALALHLQAIVDDNEEIPQPQGIQSYLEAVENSEGEAYFLTHIPMQSVTQERSLA